MAAVAAFVKEEQHLDVRELREAPQRFGRERLDKGDARFFRTLEVVLGERPRRLEETNCPDRYVPIDSWSVQIFSSRPQASVGIKR